MFDNLFDGLGVDLDDLQRMQITQLLMKIAAQKSDLPNAQESQESQESQEAQEAREVQGVLRSIHDAWRSYWRAIERGSKRGINDRELLAAEKAIHDTIRYAKAKKLKGKPILSQVVRKVSRCMLCQDCESFVSRRAHQCPSCGAPVHLSADFGSENSKGMRNASRRFPGG